MRSQAELGNESRAKLARQASHWPHAASLCPKSNKGPSGAGKSTLAKVLAGEAQPAAGSVRRSGTVGYLPQDPRTGNLDMLAIDRVLSARGLDQLRAELRAAEAAMAGSDSAAAAAARAARGWRAR